MTRPIVVTGCGRSGTHWLARILASVLGPEAVAHEPSDYTQFSDVVVDPRLRFHLDHLDSTGHPVIHLVRDGRDVVRSLHQWYQRHGCIRTNSDGQAVITGKHGDPISFEECCLEWQQAIDIMGHRTTVRVEDLSTPEAKDAQSSYVLPHWTEWDDEMTETFWSLCGDAMKRMGYERGR